MLVRTEGFVLRSIPFKESSRLITLYSLELGRITVIAHGSQSKKSRFGAAVQPLSHVQAVIYTRPMRSIQILSDCSHVQRYPVILDDLGRLTIGQRICEYVQALTEDGQRSPEIYHLLVKVFDALNSPDINGVIIQLYFQLQLTTLLGFAPAFSKESVEEICEIGGYLMLVDGSIAKNAEGKTLAVHASRSVLRAFATLHRADLSVILRLQLTRKQCDELHQLITRFMRYHMEDSYPDRGERVFDQLLRPSENKPRK